MATDWTQYVNQMYDSQMAAQKEAIKQDENAAYEKLNDQKIQAQKQTDVNLTRTDVESKKAQKNFAEVKQAYGLTSGASAQARLASDNQLQADLTALRVAQQEGDAMRERERGRIAEYYASAIREAQAKNDLERAKMLYELAREAEANMNSGGGWGGGWGGYSPRPKPNPNPNPDDKKNPLLDPDNYHGGGGDIDMGVRKPGMGNYQNAHR